VKRIESHPYYFLPGISGIRIVDMAGGRHTGPGLGFGNTAHKQAINHFHFSPEKPAAGQFITESFMASPRAVTGPQHHRSTGIPKTRLRVMRSPKSFIRIPQRYTKPLLKIIPNSL
jgi:hypothetical protein